MSELKSQLESLLLVTSKPISYKKISEILAIKPKEAEELLIALSERYAEEKGGLRLALNNQSAQMVSAPENAELVKAYLKDDLTGELSDPSLETLTIVAYRQPITKAELEQIRGVNCSLILRNLLIRGLVEAEYSKERAVTEYCVTLDFLKFLGIASTAELPDFEKLNSNENLQKLLSQETAQVEADEDKTFKVEVHKE